MKAFVFTLRDLNMTPEFFFSLIILDNFPCFCRIYDVRKIKIPSLTVKDSFVS